LGLNATYVTSSYEYKVADLLCRPFNGIKSYDLVLEVSEKCASFWKRGLSFFNHVFFKPVMVNIKYILFVSVGSY
jgi:hypothetical protein